MHNANYWFFLVDDALWFALLFIGWECFYFVDEFFFFHLVDEFVDSGEHVFFFFVFVVFFIEVYFWYFFWYVLALYLTVGFLVFVLCYQLQKLSLCFQRFCFP